MNIYQLIAAACDRSAYCDNLPVAICLTASEDEADHWQMRYDQVNLIREAIWNVLGVHEGALRSSLERHGMYAD